jgi:superfamily II DNA/RNA helicase
MDQVKQFSEYKLHPNIMDALQNLGFENATPIQDQAIPLVISGKDVAGLAQTGTGKTAAFLLPLIERVLRAVDPSGDEELDKRAFADWKPGHFNLVLVPTRELAEQVKDCAMDFLKESPHRVVVVYGGVSIEKQVEQLNKGFTFLIATPGRLIDHYKENRVDLKQVRSVTFDEADRMFDMGFKDDMKYILRRLPEDRQLLLFSATLNLDVFNVAYQFGSDPVEIKVSQDKKTADNVDDRIFHLGNAEKPAHLLALIHKLKPKQIIIFTNFKSNVERIAEFLNKNGQKAVGISSLLSQSQRKQVMTRFRADDGENILVATDVAARGLDIEGVDLVINYELSDDAENYVHRIGRTGRAGETGKAFSFVSDKDVEALDRIQKYLNRNLESEWMDDVDLPKDFVAFPRCDLMAHKNRGKTPRSDSRDGKRRSSGPRRNTSLRRDDSRGEGQRKEGGQRKRYNKERNEENAADSASAATDGDSKRVHRDKRSGRHRTAGQDKAPTSPRRRQSRSGKNGSASSGAGSSKKSTGSRRRSKSRTNTNKPASNSGVIGKITSAFRNLFR